MITQSLVVASLLGTRRVSVIMAGGMVRQDELSCVGPAAVECVQRYNTDIAVIGAAGVSARRGITDLDDPRPASSGPRWRRPSGSSSWPTARSSAMSR